MHEGETIKQPQERIKQLELENELLKAKICELEARLAQYENAHNPPSLRRGDKKNTRSEYVEGGRHFLAAAISFGDYLYPCGRIFWPWGHQVVHRQDLPPGEPDP